jgi:aminomuconate-semialdehyde/2-hydroxymuconate-6-semialdehyde dehydrogenase
MKKLKNFINGEFASPVGGKYLTKISPANGEEIYELAASEEIDVVNAVKAANEAFEDWSKTKADDRSRILYKISDLIERNLEDLAVAETEDVGKPLQLSRTMDIPRAATNFRFFASRIIHKSEKATSMDGEAINYELRQPLGVVGLISPWNLPLYLLTWKIAPAIACGNTAVCKPSELTSKTAIMLCEIMNQAGLPKGVCNMVLGLGEPVGRTIAEHPGVAAVSFTGGTATGAKIQSYAGSQFKKVSLELGGKNATIVLADADLKRAIPTIIRAAFLNQGEICLAGSKILVQEEILEEFTELFVEVAKTLRVGDPKGDKTFMGPLISEAHFEKVAYAVESAKNEKAKILLGGEKMQLASPFNKGFFYPPTIIGDLDPCSDLHQTEIFGPVVTINGFKYAQDAVKLANNSPYGLSAAVFTKDLTKAHKLAADLKVGTVWINSWMHRDLRMPFGGQKHSGLGREGGDESIDFFTEKKTVCVQL